MNSVRVRVGTLMLALAFVAVGIGLGRAAWADGSPIISGTTFWIAPALLTLADLLLFQIAARILTLRRAGRVSGSFVVGFQAATWALLGGLLTLSLVAHRVIDRYIDGIVGPLVGLVPEATRRSPLFSAGFWALFILIFAGPILLGGLIGGAIVRRLGIVVEIRVGRRADRPQA